MKLKSLRDISIKNKKVVMRVDYNVSMGKGLEIVDDTRIKHTIPTIKLLLDQGCRVVLLSHLGRPDGKFEKKFSLAPVAAHLANLMGIKVDFVGRIDGKLEGDGSLYLLENVRFYEGEKSNDKKFAKLLASYGEVFVNDAFGVSHREEASVVGIAKFLPSYAGLSLSYEVKTITEAVDDPREPFVVIVGGAKVADKIGMLRKLMKKADYILIGGGMANTFLCAKGYEMGKSYCELDKVRVAKELISLAEKSKTKMLLPSDVIVGNLKTGEHNGPVMLEDIPPNMQALDIGPKTEVEYGNIIAQAGTIIWNGPMGVFEEPQFAVGTDFIFHSLTSNEEAMVIVGGGDTLASIKKQEHLERIDHISTGGGAMLELIENGTLPGIEVLKME